MLKLVVFLVLCAIGILAISACISIKESYEITDKENNEE